MKAPALKFTIFLAFLKRLKLKENFYGKIVR